MVKRICPKCNVVFNQKCHYDYHINRKFDCNPNSKHLIPPNDEKSDDLILCMVVREPIKFVQNDKNEKNVQQNLLNLDLVETNNHLTNIDKTIFCCSYCNKNYSSNSTLTRHMKDSCKIKKDSDNKKENIFQLLLEKDKENKDRIDQLEKQNKIFEKQNKILMNKIDKLIGLKENSKPSKIVNDNKTITNNLSNTINDYSKIQNNIVMVNFGKEDLSIIDEKLFIDKIIKKNTISGVKIPDEVLKIIHFNPMYPQLSNIYISDINRDKCMVYENGEWILSNIDNIPQIMDKICLFSQEQLNTLKNKYPNNKPLQDRLKVIQKYNNMIDNDYLEELKDDIENNKNEIKRFEDFQKNTHNTLKKTLYNEGKKLKKINKQN
jgi:hypothetical protein